MGWFSDHTVKESGKNSWDHRDKSIHGSKPAWKLAKLAESERRDGERSGWGSKWLGHRETRRP